MQTDVTDRTPTAPELLYLLHGDPSDLAETLASMRAADVVEALGDLPPDAAAKVMAALPFDLAVVAFDEPELTHHRADIITRMSDEKACLLIDAMSADRQADLFRELPEGDRSRFLKLLDETRSALELLLGYPSDSAGGIMTTEFVSMPTTWTVRQALDHIRDVGRSKETVYAIYSLDPERGTLAGVASLRDLMVASDRSQTVGEFGNRSPISVTARTDDVIDAIVREQTEDVQKFGGMEPVARPISSLGSGR